MNLLLTLLMALAFFAGPSYSFGDAPIPLGGSSVYVAYNFGPQALP
jgi:hypothetical protein